MTKVMHNPVAHADPTLRESHALIASDKVEGTDVYRPNGDKIGHIERIMIDKRSGHAAYAVMNFGGFMGLGEDSYPLPWQVLTYNPELGGYEVALTDEQLKTAPKYRKDEDWTRDNRGRDLSIYDYYGAAPFWL
ncbi:PRC-barrel domain-containing protein [soil metagenome]